MLCSIVGDTQVDGLATEMRLQALCCRLIIRNLPTLHKRISNQRHIGVMEIHRVAVPPFIVGKRQEVPLVTEAVTSRIQYRYSATLPKGRSVFVENPTRCPAGRPKHSFAVHRISGQKPILNARTSRRPEVQDKG